MLSEKVSCAAYQIQILQLFPLFLCLISHYNLQYKYIVCLMMLHNGWESIWNVRHGFKSNLNVCIVTFISLKAVVYTVCVYVYKRDRERCLCVLWPWCFVNKSIGWCLWIVLVHYEFACAQFYFHCFIYKRFRKQGIHHILYNEHKQTLLFLLCEILNLIEHVCKRLRELVGMKLFWSTSGVTIGEHPFIWGLFSFKVCD